MKFELHIRGVVTLIIGAEEDHAQQQQQCRLYNRSLETKDVVNAVAYGWREQIEE